MTIRIVRGFEGMSDLDLLLINPGGREQIYQELGEELTAVEPPMWCGIIANNARIHGLSVKIIDSEAERWGPETVAAKVAELNPTLVGLIVFGHQPSASTQQMVGARATAEAIKARTPDQQVIIVGGHVAALPERTLREEQVDFACNGEGPITIRELVAQLKSGKPDFAAVPGLVWRDGETIRQNLGAPLIQDLDKELPGSAWDLLPMDKYRAHNWQCFGDLSKRTPYASIYTTLGCPYKCSFCCINAPFGKNGYRMRSPENVVAEIDHLVNTYNVRTFKIVDEMFVLNERHVMAICDLLIERNYGLNIWAYARVDTVKPHFLDKLKRAGFQWLALGIESGSKHVRDGARKALKDNDIVNIVRMIQQAGINVIGNFIFGLPDDTEESMRATLELAQELNCEFSNFYSAMAYPGSPLYAMAVEKGWTLPENWSGYSQHSYDCRPLDTEHVGADTVLAFRDAAFHAYFTSPRYLDMVTQRFGWETRKHIEQMTKHRLKRQLLEGRPPLRLDTLESAA
jgi:anaerobic magnesium-protoporphyrin IX monomethyl ester cyclase